jgi:hypothetical protein
MILKIRGKGDPPPTATFGKLARLQGESRAYYTENGD